MAVQIETMKNVADKDFIREYIQKSEALQGKDEMKKQVEEEVLRFFRGAAEVITVEDLIDKIIESKLTKTPLKIKLGIDPTAPHVHLGFAVVLRKMRLFQDLGHRVQLLIGDFTARVGDPSGRSVTRKMLSTEEIEENAKTYKEQLSLILDPEKTDVVFNSTWLEPLNFSDILKLTSKYTVARIMERDDFSNRFSQGHSIGMHEILYPLMQGYDSVALQSDVEMGGTDQKFNILVGRDLQREYGQEPQVAFFMPILEGTDGVRKMSKSYGNYIGITDPPKEMFGKVMSIPDELISRYFELCTDVDMNEVKKMQLQMVSGEANPRDVKMRLAREIIAIYHDEFKAKKAQDEFLKVFSQGELPSDMPVVAFEADGNGEIGVAEAVIKCGFAKSKREARRLISQGAVKIDEEKIEDERGCFKLDGEKVVQVGSRRFARIRPV